MTALDDVLRAAVDGGHVHGVVATAANCSGTLYTGAAGVRVAGGDDPMTPDTVFRIASMTKMVTTAAALQLVERGALDLDTPVDEILPAFGDLGVLEGFDGDTPRLRTPADRATVRHLVTHTSGLAYRFWNTDIDRWFRVTRTPDRDSGAAAALDAPLVADPGTRFEYGASTDWLGLVVEAVSGETLDAYWRAHLFGPLGMRDTTVRPDAGQRARLTPTHVRDGGGNPVPTGLDWPQDPDYRSGGHCLYSTPWDYLLFQRMLLGGGSLGGTRVLAESTVDAVFSDQLGDLGLGFPPHIATADPGVSADFTVGPGYTWGLGLLLDTAGRPGMRAAGSGGWAGLFNTYFWVDRATGVTGAVYAQSLPFVEPRVYAVYEDVERALYAWLNA
jgi:methyl acetate hydrolase